MPGRRLMVFDRTCTGRRAWFGLSHAWRSGASLYEVAGRLDAWHGAASWSEALTWLADESEQPIDEIQYWGHGRWGRVLIAKDALDVSALTPEHALHGLLGRVRARLHRDSLLWLRTCETFGTAEGHAFARGFADFLGCRVAGHTYRIGSVQSGLHVVAPGESPAWSVTEGLPGGAGPHRAARGSRLWLPNTITCLHRRPPRR